MILVYDRNYERIIDIETGHTFERGEGLSCCFGEGQETINLHGDTAAGLWAWLVKASLRFEPTEAGHGIQDIAP